MSSPGPHVLTVLADVARHPVRVFVRHWNWKASLFSSVCRASIFFATNVAEGLGPASRAMATEVVFRAIASGILGSLTQALRDSRPRIATLVVLPALGHAAEFVVHFEAGTPRLGQSVAASVLFSVVTTAFNLFAMRRGALIVGPGSQPLLSDLARMPRLFGGFVAACLRALRTSRWHQKLCT
jgi:hypothetical protein